MKIYHCTSSEICVFDNSIFSIIVLFHSRIIEFKDKDTARKAIEKMHRYKLKDRNIVVREVRHPRSVNNSRFLQN